MARDPFGLVGQPLAGRYNIESAVAEGGFGVVYRGVHETLHKAIAIKVLKVPERLSDELRGEFLESFAREARLIANLDHPAIVKVIDFGASPMPIGEVAPWMVLDWLTGDTLEADLSARRGSGGRSPAQALALLRPVFEALAAAHELGVAHRDVKPANLMLVGTGVGRRGTPLVKLMDFGIAKVMSPEEGPSRGETQTRASFVAFSPQYASPEQVSGTRTGPWTDVHAMALVLTELLCDRAPYEYGDALGLQLAVLASKRPTPGALGFDVGAWEAVIAKALAVRPNERFQECGAFLTALDEALPGAVRAVASAGAGIGIADTVKREGPPSVPELGVVSGAPSSGGTTPLGPQGPQGTLPSLPPERASGLHTFSAAVTSERPARVVSRRRSSAVVGAMAVGVVLVGAGVVVSQGRGAGGPPSVTPRSSAPAVEPTRVRPVIPAAIDAGGAQMAAPVAVAPTVVAAPPTARASDAEPAGHARGHRDHRPRASSAAPTVVQPPVIIPPIAPPGRLVTE